MSFDELRPSRHPLCTCLELTWDAVTGCADAPDYDACRSRAPLGIDPHPVIDPRTHDLIKALLTQRQQL